MRKSHLLVLLAFLLSVVAVGRVPLRAADTLPDRYSDQEFWQMITDFSEPGGSFQYENFVSNEVSYQDVLSELKRLSKPGGVYLGVAPEQNFTYIDVVRPKVAFILDIRRQNLLELLLYKALFEMGADRADFISRLFSRPRPAGLGPASSADQLFTAFDAVKSDAALYAETLQSVKNRLIRQHRFPLTADDEKKIEYVFNVFFRGGPRMDYGFASSTPNNTLPSYYNLMVATDGRGQNWAYLEKEERYRHIRDMQQRNLIVPLVADFAGPKTLRAIAKYVRDHGAAVSVFYISNVEEYLESSWPSYVANLAALPADESTLLIRFVPHANTTLGRIPDVPQQWHGVYWH